MTFSDAKEDLYEEPLYVISTESTDHNDIANQLAKSFCKYFDLTSLEVIFLSEEVYNNLETYGNDYEGEDGFYASYRISDNGIYIVEQNYVKITDGVGYKLQFGDSCTEKLEALSNSNWFYSCIKIVPSELNFTADEFGLVTIHNNDLPDLRKFDLDDSDTVTYLYVYRPSAAQTYLYFGEKKED